MCLELLKIIKCASDTYAWPLTAQLHLDFHAHLKKNKNMVHTWIDNNFGVLGLSVTILTIMPILCHC